MTLRKILPAALAALLCIAGGAQAEWYGGRQGYGPPREYGGPRQEYGGPPPWHREWEGPRWGHRRYGYEPPPAIYVQPRPFGFLPPPPGFLPPPPMFRPPPVYYGY